MRKHESIDWYATPLYYDIVFEEDTTREGDFIEQWRDHYHPMDIYVDAAGGIHVTDQVPRLSRLDGHGALVGRCKPVPVGAHGIWGDSSGNLFLAEVAPIDRVTRLAPMPRDR